jgi:hypothetical protein
MLAEPSSPQCFGGSESPCLISRPNSEGGTQGPALEALLKYDWENRWLNGPEYGHLLLHAEEYLRASIFHRFAPKTHPVSTYSDPQSELPLRAFRRPDLSG